MANSLDEVVEDTLETALGNAALLEASRKVIAPRVTFLITEHAQQGNFLGGGSQEDGTGYSESTLPAFFLGDLKKSSGGRWQLQSHELNKTVTPKSGDLIWRFKDGSPTAYLLGGYKEFRRLAGRSNDFVNLTFTGRMLGSVTSRAKVTTTGIEIETGATGGQQAKAGYTDAMYEWLGLFDSEEKDIKNKLIKWIDDKFDSQSDVTIKPSG